MKDDLNKKENIFIRENSEVMAKKELAENEVRFLRDQIDDKEDKIDQLNDKIIAVKNENNEKEEHLKELNILQEKNANENKNKEIEKYKLDYDHICKLKENIEINYQSLQKENIEVINKNSELSKTHQNSRLSYLLILVI